MGYLITGVILLIISWCVLDSIFWQSTGNRNRLEVPHWDWSDALWGILLFIPYVRFTVFFLLIGYVTLALSISEEEAENTRTGSIYKFIPSNWIAYGIEKLVKYIKSLL